MIHSVELFYSSLVIYLSFSTGFVHSILCFLSTDMISVAGPTTPSKSSLDNQAQAALTKRVSIGVPVSIGIVMILLVVLAVIFVIRRRRKRNSLKYSAMQDFSTNNDVYHLAPNSDIQL